MSNETRTVIAVLAVYLVLSAIAQALTAADVHMICRKINCTEETK
jgi:hypothetical protein